MANVCPYLSLHNLAVCWDSGVSWRRFSVVLHYIKGYNALRSWDRFMKVKTAISTVRVIKSVQWLLLPTHQRRKILTGESHLAKPSGVVADCNHTSKWVVFFISIAIFHRPQLTLDQSVVRRCSPRSETIMKRISNTTPRIDTEVWPVCAVCLYLNSWVTLLGHVTAGNIYKLCCSLNKSGPLCNVKTLEQIDSLEPKC